MPRRAGYEIDVVLGSNIRACRARLNLSQGQMAEKMRELGFPSWSHTTVSAIERGRRNIGLVEFVNLACGVFGADFDVLDGPIWRSLGTNVEAPRSWAFRDLYPR